MHGNATHSHSDAAIVSVVAVDAPEVVTSASFDERLAPTYERLGTKPGLLVGLAGIHERRWWPEEVTFAEAAAMAGQKAIDEAGIKPSDIGLLIDTSVCREYLEPSAAVAVHHMLDLPSSCLNFDLANACLGFMNAMHLAGTLIDAGQINYALVVDGEGSRRPQLSTLERLASPEATMSDLVSEFATLTLGSGAAAMVLGRHSDNPGSHRVLGGISQADTSHHKICVGTIDQMRTDSRALLDAGLHLAKKAWIEVEDLGWLDMDRYIVHQVSKPQIGRTFEVLGIDPDKTPLIFANRGNIGPASVPIILAGEVDSLTSGDRVLLLGIGSGINAMATEILW